MKQSTTATSRGYATSWKARLPYYQLTLSQIVAPRDMDEAWLMALLLLTRPRRRLREGLKNWQKAEELAQVALDSNR